MWRQALLLRLVLHRVRTSESAPVPERYGAMANTTSATSTLIAAAPGEDAAAQPDQPPADQADQAPQTEAFVGRLFEAALGAMDLFAIYLGDRLGLYAALAAGG